MPNLTVCTGPAFGVGSVGELEPANVRRAPWPFSSSPSTASAQMQAANGIRYDQTTLTPGGGLWVAQVSPNTSSSRQTGSPASPVAVSSTVTEATLSAVSFTNPSALQTLAVMVSLTWAANIAFGGSTWMEVWGGASLSVGAANVPWGALDSDGGGTGSFTWTGNGSDSLAFTVAPAATVVLTPRLGVRNVAGASAMTWNSWKLVASAVVALIDPVNVNSVGVAAIAAQAWTHGVAITPVAPVATDSNPAITSFTWSISPALPAGVTLNTATGQISGTPTAAGAITAYHLTATDSSGASAMTTFTAVVS